MPNKIKSGRLWNRSSYHSPTSILAPRQKAMEKPRPETIASARRVSESSLMQSPHAQTQQGIIIP